MAGIKPALEDHVRGIGYEHPPRPLNSVLLPELEEVRLHCPHAVREVRVINQDLDGKTGTLFRLTCRMLDHQDLGRSPRLTLVDRCSPPRMMVRSMSCPTLSGVSRRNI